MDFIKLFAAGQDHIFLCDSISLDKLTQKDIELLCNRQKGIGADGVFSICQNSLKTSQIRGFYQNGEIMRDFSTASVCAAFVLFLEKRLTHHTFSDENCSLFTVSETISDVEGLVSCDLGKGHFDLKYPATEKKTQLGNRILTLTASELHGIHTVHFSECKDKLNLAYLGEQVAKCSLFQKQADLILAEKRGNDFDIDYFGKNTVAPPLSAYGAAALSACRTENTAYDEEIRITYKNEEVFTVCKKDKAVLTQCRVTKIFQGKV